MSTTRQEPQSVRIAETANSRIVLNTDGTPLRVLTIVVNGVPVTNLTALEAQALLDLLAERACKLDQLASCIHHY